MIDRRQKIALAVVLPLGLLFLLGSLRWLRMQDHQSLYRSLSDWASIEAARDKALARGFHRREKGDMVPARLVADGASYDVSIRLKGDKPDHWSDPLKWSLRVKVKGQDLPFGIKKFSLQDPETRGGTREVVAHELLKEGGVIALRHRFVTLAVNGQEWGLTLFEEHAGTALAEHARGDGAIAFQFDEDLYWQKYFEQPDSAEYYLTASAKSYGKKGKPGSKRWKAREKAKALIKDFKSGQASASQVFNVKTLAWLIAVCDLFDSYPALQSQNLKLVYLPEKSLFEPVGGELSLPGGQGTPLAVAMDSGEGGLRLFAQALLKDPVFKKHYHDALKTVSAANYLENFLDEKLPGLHLWARLCAANRRRDDSGLHKDLRWLSELTGLTGGRPSDKTFSVNRILKSVDRHRKAAVHYLENASL